MAVGMIEVQGFSIAMAVADTMCKTADISIDAFDANNPPSADVRIPVIVQIKFRGGVSDVYAALDAGRREALNFLNEDEIVTNCIPMENEELMPLILGGKLKPVKKKEKAPRQAKEEPQKSK